MTKGGMQCGRGMTKERMQSGLGMTKERMQSGRGMTKEERARSIRKDAEWALDDIKIENDA